jgi:hypothetical protein
MEELIEFMDSVAERKEHALFYFWEFDLKRKRKLRVSTSSFDMMVDITSENTDGLPDVVILFNRDYDGVLTKEKVKEIYHAITNNHLTDGVADTANKV